MATALLGAAIRRGLAAARGASGLASKAGQLFFSTDTKTLAHDDGASWEDVANLTTFGTTAGTAAEGNDARLSDARTPTGGAGGVLSGTYPNPGFAADMATQAELDAHTGDTTAAHAATAIAFTPTSSIAATTVQAAIEEVGAEAGGLSNPMTTPADLIVGGTSGAPARLAKGSDGQVLTVDPTTHLLVWATPSGGGAALTVEELDGSPTDSAITKIVFPNGTLAIASHVATYTPAAGGGGITDPTTTIGDIIYKDGVPDSIDYARTSNGATITRTAARGDSPASNLIDGNDSTQWSFAGQGTNSPQSATVAFNTTRTVSKVRVRLGDIPGAAYTATSYKIELSTDGSTWTVVVAAYTPLAQDTTHTFGEFPGATHIRLTCLANTGSDGAYFKTLEARTAAVVSLVRLPIGTAGQVLTVTNVSGNLVPRWA